MSDADANTGGQTSPSAALALRTPTALKRAPSFYPTGHADGWKVFTVAFGAPIAVGTAIALVGSGIGLGVGAAALGVLASPFGTLGAHHWFSARGKSNLRRAQQLYAHDTARGLAALQRVAASGALPEIRLEAAARVAIDALSRGDVVAAIEALSLREQDIDAFRRRRNWEAGLRAEVLRSILAWLSPGSFTDSGVASSEDISDAEADTEGAALLAALRVLERASEPDDGPLAIAWSDVEGSTLEAELPTLHMIALAVTAERLHQLLDDFHDRLRRDGSGNYRQLLRRLFPRMQIIDEGGYRHMSPDDPVGGATSLAVVAPTELQELAQPIAADLVPASRGTAAATLLTTYGIVFAASTVLTLAAGGPGFVGALIGFAANIYVGTPFGAIWGSRRVQRRERERRVAPLARLSPPPPAAWLTECASGPPGPVTPTSGYRRLVEIPPSQMVLYLAAMKGEQALARGDLDEAWARVEWWFAGFSGKLSDPDSLYASGSSLVRIAALSGRLTAARRLLSVMPEVGNKWDDALNRTVYGNAPRAVGLAAALVAGLGGQWDAVNRHLSNARFGKAVHIPPRDEALIAELVRRTRAHGAQADWNIPHASRMDRGWLEQIWPEDVAPPLA
ncbi:MAG: hypothetical protein AAF799_37070 [Myxococcota bacterium]